MLRIKARHIQVADLDSAQTVMSKWQQGIDFAELARAYSNCPTAKHGGSLGEFGRGHFSPKLDAVFFGGDVGNVYGPVESEQGFHLIEILAKNEYA